MSSPSQSARRADDDGLECSQIPTNSQELPLARDEGDWKDQRQRFTTTFTGYALGLQSPESVDIDSGRNGVHDVEAAAMTSRASVDFAIAEKAPIYVQPTTARDV